MAPALIYTISILGAVGLYLLLRPAGLPTHAGERPLRALGALFGLAAVAWMIVSISRHLSADDARPEAFYTIFTIIALASAVRMITHHRPVYCALYFVLVVLSSAGMFLLLAAEFMAFALIIVYAGAILITYMFVLMLAQQSQSPDAATGQPEYDRVPREPGLAAGVGFILIALLSNVIFTGTPQLDSPPLAHTARQLQMLDLDLMPRQLIAAVEAVEPGAELATDAEGRPLGLIAEGDGIFAQVYRPGENEISYVELPDEAAPSNIKRVGLALVWRFPVSLELAGIILLLAMFGAVVLARRQIELSEDELRESAGMRRLAAADDEHERESRHSNEGGRP